MAKRKPVVLSQSDQAFFVQAGGKRWMRRKLFAEGPQRRYERALDAFAEKLAELGLDPGNPQALTEMLAVVLDNDGTMGAWFRDRNFPVGDTEKFARLCHAAAGALVTEYLHKADLPARSESVLIDAELQGEIARLMELAVEHGELSAEEGREAGEAWWAIDGRADLIESARAQLEELLATDVNVAHAVDEDIPEAERDREIAKAALLKLRVGELRKLAIDEELAPLRDPEALAALIARKYNADHQTIAELVLRYSTPDVERGWATRLVPLRVTPDLTSAASALEDVRGRYLRLDVATWLVISNVRQIGAASSTSGGVAFDGDLRFYAVRAQKDGEHPRIAALRRSHPISVVLRDGVSWVFLAGHSVTDVRRLRKALTTALAVSLDLRFDPKVPPLTGDAAVLNHQTVRVLSVLERGLRDAHLDYHDFRQAQFAKEGGINTEPEQIAVRAVRLQGQHVLDDPAACRYIIGGQVLKSVDVKVQWIEQAGAEAFYTTVRIGIEDDHAYVLTAFGDSPTRSGRLHDELTKRFRAALEAEITQGSVSGILSRIQARASEAEPPPSVDIWGPSAGDGQDSGQGDGATPSTDSSGQPTSTALPASGSGRSGVRGSEP